jgi:hypothetical protein
MGLLGVISVILFSHIEVRYIKTGNSSHPESGRELLHL